MRTLETEELEHNGGDPEVRVKHHDPDDSHRNTGHEGRHVEERSEDPLKFDVLVQHHRDGQCEHRCQRHRNQRVDRGHLHRLPEERLLRKEIPVVVETDELRPTQQVGVKEAQAERKDDRARLEEEEMDQIWGRKNPAQHRLGTTFRKHPLEANGDAPQEYVHNDRDCQRSQRSIDHLGTGIDRQGARGGGNRRHAQRHGDKDVSHTISPYRPRLRCAFVTCSATSFM